MRLSTKNGFTLMEVCLVLGLTGLVVGGIVGLLGSFVQEFSPKSIEYKGETYEVVPSLKVSIEAMEFHEEFIKYLEKDPMGICFGGTSVADFSQHMFFPLKNESILATWVQEKKLLNGEIRSTQELVSYIESGTGGISASFEKMATDSDLTCILLGRSIETSAWVQLRKMNVKIGVDVYNIYRAMLFAMGSKQQIAEYHFAVKE